MPFLYLAASLAGVFVLVALNWLLLRPAPPALDAPSAAALLVLDDPKIVLTGFAGGGRAALAQAADGKLYGLRVAGARLVYRGLTAGSLRRLERQAGELRLVLADPTFPAIRVALASETEARGWEAKLRAVMASD